MGTMSKIRVNVGADKESVKTRIDRAKGVATAAPTSALCKADPVLAASCNDLGACGVELQKAEDDVQAAEIKLAAARSKRDEKITSYDRAHKVCVSQIEQRATKPEDVQGTGMVVLERASHAIAAPTGLKATANHAKKEIRIQVDRAPGIDHYVIEWSGDAAEPRNWRRLPGTGARRTVANVPAGTHWVRAAAQRASDESEFAAPVAVTLY